VKLHFESDLDYQHAAVESVCDLFRGQETCRTEFTVTMKTAAVSMGDELFPETIPQQQLSLGVAESDLGIGNRLTLLDDEILANLQDIQLRNGLAPSSTLASGVRQFAPKNPLFFRVPPVTTRVDDRIF
jgi:type III restriction enzyme